MLDFCEVHRDTFFATCKAIAVEDALTGPRIADDKRKPQRSDAIDLMHSVMALAYCDYFLVVDRFAYSCAVHASKALKHAKLATIYRDPQKLRDDLIKS